MFDFVIVDADVDADGARHLPGPAVEAATGLSESSLGPKELMPHQ